jgi:hypothetical protein
MKKRFGKANGELIVTQLKVLIIFAFMNPIINMIMYIVVACILAVGSYHGLSMMKTQTQSLLQALRTL